MAIAKSKEIKPQAKSCPAFPKQQKAAHDSIKNIQQYQLYTT